MRRRTTLSAAPIPQRTSFSLSLLLYAFFFLPALAAAQDQPEQAEISSLMGKGLEELMQMEVSIATGTPKPLNLAPSVATVITAQDIDDIGATTLDEVLETVPGLHVVPSNLNRLNSGYSIRGILTKENPQVLLLIDGHPVRLTTKGSRPDTFNMSVSNISRIEIIRGPGSALYGADAFAGVINVITKKASDINGTVFGARGGSFGTTDTWVQYGGNYDGWEIALSLDYLRSDGDKDRIVDADLQTTLDAALGTHASKAPGPLETRDRILDAHVSVTKNNWDLHMWYWGQGDGGEGAGAAQALDPIGHEKDMLFLTDLTYNKKNLAPDWDMALRLNYKYIKEDNYLVLFPPGTVLPIGADGNIDFVHPTIFTQFPDGVIGNPGATENHAGIDLTADYKGLTKHTLRFGAGFKYATVDPFESKNFGPGVLDGTQSVRDGTLTDVTGTQYVFLKNADRTILYALVQDEWALMKNVQLTAGLRYDHYSDFGDTVNPRLALVWETRSDLTTKLLYGRAFRPPSFADNNFQNNPSQLGNPSLVPETINTYELAFDYRPFKRFRMALSLFTYEVEGLIEAVPDAGQTTATAQNAKDLEGHGFEIEAEWLVTNTLRLRGNVAYQRSKDKDTGEMVPDAPGLQFYANAHWKFLPEWSLDGQYFWIGNRHRASGDTRTEIKDYDLVNMTVRKKNLLKNWDIAVAVRNLFNNDAREPSQPSIPNDYPLEGRSFWAELRYHF